jgi:hypothetical protein
MITADRRELNDRFREVFQILEDRGEIIKNDRNGRGLGDFAKRILNNRSYGHIIRAYLNPADKRCINYEQARRVCNEYGINPDYLLEGKGTPFGMEIPTPPASEGDDVKQNILFTSTEAFAGASVDQDSFLREEAQFFSLPDLFGDGYVAFPINGNSMEPVINDGDIIICRQIGGVHEIKENKIYAVRTKGSIWVKYVQPMKDSKGRIHKLKLISANYLEHDPWTEDVDKNTRLYEVQRRISEL